MSDYVWVCNVDNDYTLTKRVETDLGDRDIDALVKTLRTIGYGQRVEPEDLPKEIYLQRGKGTRMPAIFSAGGLRVLNEVAASIFAQHDLGEGYIHPVKLFLRDKVTPAKGEFFCWVFGNKKQAFTAPDSTNLRPFGNGTNPDWANMPYEPADFDVAVRPEAHDGPDVWLDPPLVKSIFLSRSLGDALAAKRLTQTFRLHKARVVSA